MNLPLTTATPSASAAGLVATATPSASKGQSGDNAAPPGFGAMVDAVGDAPVAVAQPVALAADQITLPAKAMPPATLLALPAKPADAAATPAGEMPGKAVATPAPAIEAQPAPPASDAPADSAALPTPPTAAEPEGALPSLPPPATAQAAPLKPAPSVEEKDEGKKDAAAEGDGAQSATPIAAALPAVHRQPELPAPTAIALAAPDQSAQKPSDQAPQPQADGDLAQTAPASPATATRTAQAVETAPTPPPGRDNLPSTLFSQALGHAPVAHSAPAIASTYAASPASVAADTPVVRAQAGQIGRDMGALIARHVVDGREQMTVRLNPPEMGRIDVRLSFDHGGGLRAVMAAESPAAMDLLRRDVGDLNRALSDAGVRTDAQSFRFDSRHSGGGFAQPDQQQRQQREGQGSGASDWADNPGDRPASSIIHRPLRTSGGIDMIA